MKIKNSLIWNVTDLPEEFIKQMKSRLGTSYPAFLVSLQQPAPVSVRYNTRKLSRPPENEIPWCTTGQYLHERPSFTLDPFFHAGGYYVQEASSMLLEQAVRKTMKLDSPIVALDLCAAPGGKSTHLLSLLSKDSLLVSNEVIRSRASVLTENIEKWGYDNIIVTNNDPSDFSRLTEFFDLILIDAPCSGEGLFRKEPESIEEWSPKNVELCSLRQRRIVSEVWNSLKPGGVMIYSTCTYSERENLENLAWLTSQQDLIFENLVLDPDWGVTVLNHKAAIGYQCFPHRVKGEGFFFSAIRKSGNVVGKKIKTKDALRYPTKVELSNVMNWMLEPERRLFFLHDQQIRMIPSLHQNLLRVLLEKLHVIYAGTAIGEIMKNKIVPDHGLALSTELNKSKLLSIPMDGVQALDYLRKNNLNLTSPQTGFHLVEFQGLPLGWVNMLGGRINNLYPSGRRILMK